MKPHFASILLPALLILSQILAFARTGAGLAWCHHPDGEVVVETATEQADCHAEQESSGDLLKSCLDVPIGEEKSSQPSRTDSSRELAALQAATLFAILPVFGVDFHCIASTPAIPPRSDDDTASRGVVLDSLSTVIILT